MEMKAAGSLAEEGGFEKGRLGRREGDGGRHGYGSADYSDEGGESVTVSVTTSWLVVIIFRGFGIFY